MNKQAADQRERANAFKVGFLYKLAKAGISPRGLFERVKRADLLDPIVSGLVDVGKSAIPSAAAIGSGLQTAGFLGLGAPLAAGAALGAAQSSLEAPTGRDIEVLRQAELAGMYRRLAAEIRARAKTRTVGGRR